MSNHSGPHSWRKWLGRNDLLGTRPPANRQPLAVEALEARNLLSVATPVIDLYVGYTTGAKDAAGGTAPIVNQITQGVADINQYLVNSQINETVRLVQTPTEIAGYKPASQLAALNDLAKPPDALKPFLAAQATFGADLNVEVTEHGGGFAGGLYSVTGIGAFIHEIGHLLGADHDSSDPGVAKSTAQAYAVTVGAAKFFTATADGMGRPDVPFWSNPTVSFRGVPVGTAQANAALTLNQNAAKIAAYQATKVPDTTGPRGGLGPVLSVNGSNAITLKVIYYDDCGINADSLASSTIAVTGPNGFSGTATFTGFSTKEGGDPSAVVPLAAATVNAPVIVANYTVTTTGAVGDLGAYTFAIGAKAVKDQAGNAASGALVNASGIAQTGQTPLLPAYAPQIGGTPTSTGLAAEQGDLAGRTWQLTDYVGVPPGGGARSNLYRFGLSNDTTLTLKSNTDSIDTYVFQDTANSGVAFLPFFPGVAPIDAQADGSYKLQKGTNYYIQALAGNPAVYGPFTITATTTGTAAAPAPGTLQFSQAEYSVVKNAGTVQIVVSRTNGTGGAVSLNYATSDGTGVAGQDYQALNGVVNFVDGQSKAVITVPVIDNAARTTPVTVNLTLSSPTGGATLGTQATAVLTVQVLPAVPAGAPGALQFGLATYNVAQNAASAEIMVTRTGGTLGAVTINYATSDGSAKAGQDYTPATGTLAFTAGQVSSAFSVPIRNNPNNAGPVNVNLALTSPGGGATLGTQNTAVLSITPVPAPVGAGTLQFSAATYTATNDGAGPTISFTITRTGGSAGTVTVAAGLSGTLLTKDSLGNTVPTSLGNQTITLTLGSGSTDIFFPGLSYELVVAPSTDPKLNTVQLTLSNPTGGATLGAQATATAIVPPSGPGIDGKAIGGYLQGSTVFLDLNGNSIRDDGEPAAATAADGSYHLPYSTPFDLSHARLIIAGGTDTATGQPVVVPFTAPPNASVITPFTTLIGNVALRGELDENAAVAKVRQVFGLNSVNLLNYDPIGALAAGGAGATTGAPVFLDEVKLNILVTAAAGLVAGTKGSTNLTPQVEAIWSNLGSLVADASQFPNLSDPVALAAVLSSLVADAQPPLSQSVVNTAANILAGVFQLLDAIPLPSAAIKHDGGGDNYLTQVAQIEQVAETQVAPDLNKLAAGTMTPSQAQARDSLANLRTQSSAAVVGNVVPVGVALDASLQTVRRDPSKPTTLTFTVSLDAVPSALAPVSVHYATVDGTATAANGDYLPTSGTLTWTSDDAPKTITVQVPAGTAVGAARSFQVVLSSPQNAVVHGTAAIGVVLPSAPPGPGTISGRVFLDANANGAQDGGEAGIAGVTVYLDANGNGRLDLGEATATTGQDGSYTLANLPARTYAVRVNAPLTVPTVPTSGITTVTLKGGTERADFGLITINAGLPVAAPKVIYAPPTSKGEADADNKAFIRGLYHSILDRDAEADGRTVAYWDQLLNQVKMDPQAVGLPDGTDPYLYITKAFWTSEEHRWREVESYYHQFLGRDLNLTNANDLAARLYWANQFKFASATEADVVSGFIASAEYLFAHRGDASLAAVVNAGLLAGTAAPADLQAWTTSLSTLDTLRTGMKAQSFASPNDYRSQLGASLDAFASQSGKAGAVFNVLHSDAFAQRALDSFFIAFLHRAGTPAEEQQLRSQHDSAGNPLDLGTLAEMMLASPEYRANAARSEV